MKSKKSFVSTNLDDIVWLRILSAYQILRGFLGVSLWPFPLDFLFRILLCSIGVLAFLNKKVGIILLFITLLASIPYIAIISKSTYFYWPPVVFTPPINIGFSLLDIQNGSGSEGTRISLHGVYVILLFTLGKTLKRLLSDE
jgi:hypothetical protein